MGVRRVDFNTYKDSKSKVRRNLMNNIHMLAEDEGQTDDESAGSDYDYDEDYDLFDMDESYEQEQAPAGEVKSDDDISQNLAENR